VTGSPVVGWDMKPLNLGSGVSFFMPTVRWYLQCALHSVRTDAMSHYSRIRANTSLVTDRQLDYAEGRAAGAIDRAHCETDADRVWYVGVVFGNLWETRPHYVAGYNDAINAN
jgi:hypothetical protein